MIVAHMATFPPRKDIMLEAVRNIAPQVDKLKIFLNEYEVIPSELSSYRNVKPHIDDKNIKDAGKFYFDVNERDVVFTIDDDILFPDDYVERTLKFGEKIGFEKNVIGYHAHAWVFRKNIKRMGWRNFFFHKQCGNIIEVDVIGTGTACFLGKNAPPYRFMESSSGFVDIRFSLYQRKMGNRLWTLPRDLNYLAQNLPDSLQESSIFNTVTRKGSLQISLETRELIKLSPQTTGLKYDDGKELSA